MNFIAGIVKFAFNLIFPRAPSWVGALLSEAIPLTVELVAAMGKRKDKTGPEKFAFVVANVTKILDETFDQVPEWAALEEDRRDRIIGGFAELAYFVHKVAPNAHKGRKKRGRKRRARLNALLAA